MDLYITGDPFILLSDQQDSSTPNFTCPIWFTGKSNDPDDWIIHVRCYGDTKESALARAKIIASMFNTNREYNN